VLNVCLICSALLIVEVIYVITVCVSTILVNKDDQCNVMQKRGHAYDLKHGR